MSDVGLAGHGPTAVLVGIGAAASGTTAVVASGLGQLSLSLLATVVTVVLVGGLPWLARTTPFRTLMLVAVTTASWDATRIGDWSPPDLLFLLGVLGCLVAFALHRAAPLWLPRPVGLAAALMAVAVTLCAFFPPSPSYLATRVNPVTGVLAAATSLDTPSDDVEGVVRLIVVLIVIPAVVVWTANTRDAAVLLARMYCLGITLSAVLALSDYAGLTHVALNLRGFVDADGRQSGLTAHSNHLALSAAMAAPMALRLFGDAAVRVGLFGVLAAAVWLSGSRAGLIGIAIALIAHLAISRARRVLFLAVPLAAVAVLASGVVDRTRFANGAADGSDRFRTIAAQQGLADFTQSPVFGIGARALQDAHNIYLQMAASLGLLGCAAFLIVVGATGYAAWRCRADPLAVTCIISVLVFLVVGYATNEIVSRYVAIPFALVAAIVRYRSTPQEPAAAPEPAVPTHSTEARAR